MTSPVSVRRGESSGISSRGPKYTTPWPCRLGRGMVLEADLPPRAVLVREGEREVQLHLQLAAAVRIARHEDGGIAQVELLDDVPADGQ